MTYDLKDIKAPRLAGGALGFFAGLLNIGFLRGLLVPQLFRDARIANFRAFVADEAPTLQPFRDPSGADRAFAPVASSALDTFAAPDPARGFQFRTVGDFAEAYRAGRLTPEDVARRVTRAIQATEAGDRPLRAIIASEAADLMEQARASSERWRNGSPLSIFDGVPVAVKDELDQTPYPTRVGTKFIDRRPGADATPVARMRAAGALLIGKANMHEIGLGVTGLNPHYGVCRNPYNPDHHSGGSSSGSGAAVGAGLCPVAVGADGGGSVRIPASFCGVAGLKATFGRISEHGAYPLCWSVAHVGPLGATVRDVAMAYALMGGPDEHDAYSMRQPAVHLTDLDRGDLSGLRIGIFDPWFDHGASDLVAGCRTAVAGLEARGARVVDIEVPDLEAMRVGHAMTISSEMLSAMEPFMARHEGDFGLDVRINLKLTSQFTNADYLRAQRLRTLMFRHFDAAFAQCDVILTPTTGVTAPPINPAALPRGESDLTTLTKIMRFVLAGNFLGYPALSVPVGYDGAGLPIGLQIMGPHWQEHLLLRIGLVAESELERRAPAVYHDLLAD